MMGQMYYCSKGVPQNYVEAARWTLLAAKAGDVEMQFNLGTMYEEGHGVLQDYRRA